MGDFMFLWFAGGALGAFIFTLWVLIRQAIEEVRKDREARDD